VSLDFCPGDVPAWLAVKNASENWQQVTGTSGSFTFDATPRVSVAYVTSDAGDHSTRVLNVLRAELGAVTATGCAAAGTKSLSGNVTGLTGAQIATLSMGSQVDAVSTTNVTYSFNELLNGPLDLVATRYPTSGTQPADRVIVRRGLDLQTGATIPTLDFSSTEAQPLTAANLTLANRGSDFVSMTTDFLTEHGTSHPLLRFTSTNADGVTFVSVPAALRGPNDMHLLAAIASSATAVREVSQFYREPSNRTFTFGPSLSEPTVTIAATTPYRRPRLTVASQAEYDDAMEAFFSQLSGPTFRTVTVFTSAAFLGGPPATWELELPDFSGAGYTTEWAFVAGSSVNANARGFDGDVNVVLGVKALDGDMIRSSIRSANAVTP